MIFYVLLRTDFLMKIGQYPSLGDLQQPEIRKYRKVLGDDRYRELYRGIGLAASGVGIGAYVYLRRTFESLIGEARDQASKQPGWDDEAFQKAHMDQRILMLKPFLPQFLVKNRGIYSILSKGIHELTEDECLGYYDSVRLGIELILDEKEEQRQRSEKIARASKSLGAIGRELK